MSKNRRTESVKTRNTVPLASGSWQQYKEAKVTDNQTRKAGRGTGKTKGEALGKAYKDLREKS